MAQVSLSMSPARLEGLLSTRAMDLPGPRLGDPRKAVDLISFSFGFPDPASLPAREVAEATGRAMEKNGQWALQYGKTSGVPELVDVLLAKLKRD